MNGWCATLEPYAKSITVAYSVNDLIQSLKPLKSWKLRCKNDIISNTLQGSFIFSVGHRDYLLLSNTQINNVQHTHGSPLQFQSLIFSRPQIISTRAPLDHLRYSPIMLWTCLQVTVTFYSD